MTPSPNAPPSSARRRRWSRSPSARARRTRCRCTCATCSRWAAPSPGCRGSVCRAARRKDCRSAWKCWLRNGGRTSRCASRATTRWRAASRRRLRPLPDTWEVVIGMEVHVQPRTRTKMFCSCAIGQLGDPPNSNVCEVCMGLPGVLPVINKAAVEACLKTALALNCEIPKHTKFDRKNYMYPDLPKGYQISQYDLPLRVDGLLQLDARHVPIHP